MMKREIFINNKRMTLDPAQLIQSGGEGMVFGIGKGANRTAVKLYHQPTPQHVAKLRCLLDGGLAARLPANVLCPSAFVTEGNGAIIGFQMPLLPAGSLPLKKLSNPRFWQKNNLQPGDVMPLFQNIHAAITHLHQLGVVIGDLNDHNLFFTHDASRMTHHAFIDVDSYQFGGYPCPVAMPAFLDPALYQVTDFSQRPYFTPLSDWYAFAVLLFKSLLQVHPYGGAHKRYKSLLARAKAGVSVLDTAVTYPQTARPLNLLSDDLKQQIHLVFERGQRHPFPVQLLAPQHFSRQPASASVSTLQSPISNHQSSKLLLSVDGVIEHAVVGQDGRILVIVRENEGYKLIRLGIGGKLDEMTLFNGQPGYRFAVFGSLRSGQFVAVNPPQGRQLLILDVGGNQAKKVTMVETALFRETAVFAATPRHLYRIAGAWIMRGSVRDGLYVEDAIATAHRSQTQFWASPAGETIAGYHRIFAENRFFLLHDGAGYDLPIPPLAQGESLTETKIRFSPNAIHFQLHIRRNGRLRTNIHTTNLKGHLLHPSSFILHPSNTLPHPAGQIIIEPAHLYLVTA